MGIEENLAARLAAEQIAELADEEGEKHGKRFWEQLAHIVLSHVPAPRERRKPKQGPMGQLEAELFGRQLMPYGEFAGRRIDDVPLLRLQWYADQTFTDDLRRYLASDRVKREICEDD